FNDGFPDNYDHYNRSCFDDHHGCSVDNDGFPGNDDHHGCSVDDHQCSRQRLDR
ncbi:uncharacterized protein METZ01_LOCUS394784, partial [marine metagenome]